LPLHSFSMPDNGRWLSEPTTFRVCPHDGPFAPRPRTPVLEAGRQATSRKMVAIATRPSANAAHTAAIMDAANLICSTSIMRETPRAIGWSLPTCRDGLPRVWRGARVAKSRVGTAPRRRLGGRKCRPNAARNIGAILARRRHSVSHPFQGIRQLILKGRALCHSPIEACDGFASLGARQKGQPSGPASKELLQGLDQVRQ